MLVVICSSVSQGARTVVTRNLQMFTCMTATTGPGRGPQSVRHDMPILVAQLEEMQTPDLTAG